MLRKLDDLLSRLPDWAFPLIAFPIALAIVGLGLILLAITH